MRYSEIKELFETFDRDTIEKIIKNKGEIDFSSSTHRFIEVDSELDVLENVYSEEYETLGRFGVNYIVDNTSIPVEKVQMMVDAGEYEKLGKIIVKLVGVRDFICDALIDGGVAAMLNGRYEDKNKSFYLELFGTEYICFDI